MNLEVPIVHIKTSIAYMVQEGLGEGTLLDLLGLERDQLNQIDRLVNAEDYEKILNFGAEKLSQPDIGFRLGKWRDSGRWSLVGHIMNCCESGIELLTVLKRYETLGGNISTTQISHDAGVTTLQWIGHYKCSYHICEETLARWVAFLRKSISVNAAPREICFAHACRGDKQAYVDFFQCPVYFECDFNSVSLSSRILHEPLIGFNAELLKLLMGYADMVVDKKRKEAASDVLNCFILARLPEKVPTVNDAAEHLGISPRSLQRKIKERGTSFKFMVEDVRKEYAFSYLLQNNYKISDIAQILGYSEQSVFQRAFKRWQGITPGEYRHQHGLR